jgi:hypothetical protein
VRQPLGDRVAAHRAGGHVRPAALRLVQGGGQVAQRRVVHVVLELLQRQHVGVQAGQRGDRLGRLPSQLAGTVRAAAVSAPSGARSGRSRRPRACRLLWRSVVRILLVVLTLLVATCAVAQGRWSLELYTGTSFKAPSTLEIRQEGFDAVTIGDVRYDTRAFVPVRSLGDLTANYYVVRVGYRFAPARRDVRYGVELELIHDKAYYRSGDDPEGVVQDFELSDGVNYLLVNAALVVPLAADAAHPDGRGQLVARLGVGPVVTKPAATVRGRSYGHDTQGQWTGYDLAGPGVGVGLQGRWFVLPWLTVGAEAKLTAAATVSRIADGTAATDLGTLHLIVGVGLVP